ncbi:MAG: dihydrodipicolinate synthase family protein [Armatimonadota bacterium]|nr:dihydrodipicolinate synthase family protein [Armatimonadota bacterium]
MTPQDLRRRLRGVLAFAPTPFTSDGRLDDAGLARHIDGLCEAGVGAVVVCGGTGEFFSLDADEYRTVMRIAAEVARHRVPVVAGIGHATGVAVRLAEYAGSVGLDGIMVHPQYFVEPPDDGLVLHYRALAAASGLGLMIYCTPTAPVRLDLVRRLAAIDGVVALKDESGDVAAFAAVRQALGDRLAWVNGMAEMHAGPYFEAGAQAFTSGIVNFAPAISLAVWDAGARGRKDELDDLLSRCVRPLAALRARRPGAAVAVVKEAMNLLGLPGGVVRLPLTPLSPDEREELRRVLRDLRLLSDDQGGRA